MPSAHSVDAAPIRDTLGAVLREHREDAVRTLSQVAAEAGCSAAYLSEVERGLKDISAELLVAVCYALGVPAGDVYLELGRRLAPAEQHAPAWPSDPRQQLRVVSASLGPEALRTIASFGAFLAAGGEPRRRQVGFMPTARRTET